MKVRDGFVSNSSSSSFMLIGFKAPVEIEDVYIEEILDELNEQFGDGFSLDYVTDDAPECFVGETLFYTSDFEIDEVELDFAAMDSFRDKIKEHEELIREKLGVTPEVKIYAGTVAS